MKAKFQQKPPPVPAGKINDRWFNEYLPKHPQDMQLALKRLRRLEGYYRRAAGCRGYVLRKSHARKWSSHNHLAYMILDGDHTVAAGKDYDLSLDEVAEFLAAKQRA
jgi:hypothetical protein